MRLHPCHRRVQAFLALLLASPTLTWAIPPSINVVYGPVDTAVPTLGEWGLWLTAILLGVIALRTLHRKGLGNTIMLMALTFTGFIAAWQHGLPINVAWAIVGPSTYDMNNPVGGTITVPSSAGGGSVTLTNTTQVSLKIISVTPSGYTLINTTCQPGAVVAPSASCALNTVPPPT